jgi:hypothetical protein
VEARPPALRAKGRLSLPTVTLAGNGPVQLSATPTSAPTVPITARKLNPGVVLTCVGPLEGGRICPRAWTTADGGAQRIRQAQRDSTIISCLICGDSSRIHRCFIATWFHAMEGDLPFTIASWALLAVMGACCPLGGSHQFIRNSFVIHP